MRVNQHRLIRRVGLAATAAMMAMTVALAWGAGSAAASANIVCPGGESLEKASGSENAACGIVALYSDKDGGFNAAMGAGALEDNTEASGNTATGADALEENTNGKENTAIGFEALGSSQGDFNVALGNKAGKKLTTGSNNIDIANEGSAGGEGTTRIGTEGKQTKAFMAGIYPTPIEGCTVQVTQEGQLGCNLTAEGKEGKEGKEGAPGKEGPTGKEGKEGPAGDAAIATFASFSPVKSGNCLNYTELAGQGNGPCPAKKSGFSVSDLLAGPTPANGAVVTNLYADTNTTLSKEEATVAVIDNTTGITLLSCKVATGQSSCSNATEHGSAAPGDNIEVQVTAPGPRCNGRAAWRVRFRY